MSTEAPQNTASVAPQQTASAPTPSAAEPVKADVGVEATPKLSRRDALDVAIKASAESPKPPKKREVIINKETKESAPIPEPSKPKYEPPSEYSAEEKEHFLSLTPEMQAKDLRLYKGVMQRKAELARELQENGWVKDLVKDVNPFLQSLGEKLRPHEAVAAAIKLRNELENGDPIQNSINYLKRKGVEVPRELLALADGGAENKENSDIASLRKEIESLKVERDQEKIKMEAHSFLSDFDTFAGQKNDAGGSLFPDVNNSEKGLKLAEKIGSLVGGKTEVSKQFIAMVKDRNPSIDRIELFKEAYRFFGGRVDDSKAPNKAATQNHIQRSNRAAASIPGSGSSFDPKGRVKLPRREALERAWKERQENG